MVILDGHKLNSTQNALEALKQSAQTHTISKDYKIRFTTKKSYGKKKLWSKPHGQLAILIQSLLFVAFTHAVFKHTTSRTIDLQISK